MTARTVITPVPLTRDAFALQGAGFTPDAVNGNTVADPGPNHLILVIKNGDTAAHSVTIRASGSGVDASGNPQAVPPWNTVFTQATAGDLTVAVPAGDTYMSPPFTSDRFTQADGSLSLDWSASTSVTAWAFTLPYNSLGGASL